MSTQIRNEKAVKSARPTPKERAQLVCNNLIQQAAAEVPQPQERPFRSESPEVRNVAGHVERRSERPTRAEPAPSSPAKAKDKTEKRLKKGKGRQNDGFGDGDGSDSDDGSKKRSQGYDDEIAAVVRRTPPTLAAEGSGLDPSILSAEEQERLNLLRTLQALEDQWKNTKRHYKICSSRRNGREIILAKYFPWQRWKEKASSGMVTQIMEEEKALQTFKDGIVFAELDAQLKEAQQTILDTKFTESERKQYLEQVLLRVEDGVIARCGVFDRNTSCWSFDRPRPKKEQRLLGIINKLFLGLWRELVEKCPSTQDVATVTADFIAAKCTSTYPDVLVEQYIDRTSQILSEIVLRDHAAGLQQNESTLHLMQIIEKSRCDGHLSVEYISWVTSLLDRQEIELRARRFHQLDLEKRAREARTSALQLRERLTGGLEFIEDYPYDVSVVLFKGNRPFSRRLVASEELARIGWRRSCLPAGDFVRRCLNEPSPYWRYRSPSPMGYIFKVQMDGEVIGMWTPEGDIDWHPDMEKQDVEKITT